MLTRDNDRNLKGRDACGSVARKNCGAIERGRPTWPGRPVAS